MCVEKIMEEDYLESKLELRDIMKEQLKEIEDMKKEDMLS
jgi:hypothetical protein